MPMISYTLDIDEDGAVMMGNRTGELQAYFRSTPVIKCYALDGLARRFVSIEFKYLRPYTRAPESRGLVGMPVHGPRRAYL
jgi:hypothetical protein